METATERSTPAVGYPELFRFIRNNSTLQKKIDEVGATFDLAGLQSAIAQGQYDSELLYRSDAPYACLKLFQLGNLSSEQDATIFLYQLAQSSERTFKRIKHKAMFKSDTTPSDLTQTFLEYRVLPYFERMRRTDAQTKLELLLRALPISEQYFFELDFIADTDFANIIEQVGKYLGPIAGLVKNTKTVILPSIGFLHTVFRLVHEQPVVLYGFFGQINPATRHQLMRKEYRVPLARFEKLVRHNLSEAHGWIHCPFAIAFHDLLHWYWCNLLRSSEREEVFAYTDVLNQYYSATDETLIAQAPGLVHLGKRVLESLWDFEISFTPKPAVSHAEQYLEAQIDCLRTYPIFQDWHPLKEALNWEKTYNKLVEQAPNPALFRRIFPYRQGVLDAYRAGHKHPQDESRLSEAKPEPALLTQCFERVCKLAKTYDMGWLVFWFMSAHQLAHNYPPFLTYAEETLCAFSSLIQLNAIDFSPNTPLNNQQSYLEAFIEKLKMCQDKLANSDYCSEVINMLGRYTYRAGNFTVVSKILRPILRVATVEEKAFSPLAQSIMQHIEAGIGYQIAAESLFSFLPNYLNPQQFDFWQYFFQHYPKARSWKILCNKIEKAARAYEVQALLEQLAEPKTRANIRFFDNTAPAQAPEDTLTKYRL